MHSFRVLTTSVSSRKLVCICDIKYSSTDGASLCAAELVQSSWMSVNPQDDWVCNFGQTKHRAKQAPGNKWEGSTTLMQLLQGHGHGTCELTVCRKLPVSPKISLFILS